MCLIKDKEKTLNLPASLSFFRQMPPSFLYFQSCPWPTPKEQLCMCYLNIYMVSSFPIPRLYALFKPICDQFIPFSLVILGCLFGQGHLARTKMRGISGNKEKFRGILEFLPLKQWLTTRVHGPTRCREIFLLIFILSCVCRKNGACETLYSILAPLYVDDFHKHLDFE